MVMSDPLEARKRRIGGDAGDAALQAEPPSAATLFAPWHAALCALDRRIAGVLRARAEPARDDIGLRAFRGLAIAATDVVALLANSSAAPLLQGAAGTPIVHLVAPLREEPRVEWLRAAFALDDFDCAVVLLALAPELDSRYERLYGFLHDDLTRKYLSVDLCLELLCVTPAERMARRARFAADSPLDRVLTPVDSGRPTPSSALSRVLAVDPQIASLLLYVDGQDARLRTLCEVPAAEVELDDVPLEPALRARLERLVDRVSRGEPLSHAYLRCERLQARAIAGGVARRNDAHTLEVDVRALANADAEPERALALVFREAWLRDLVLHVAGIDALLDERHAPLCDALFRELAAAPRMALLSGMSPWRLLERDESRVIAFECGELASAARHAHWTRCLAASGLTPDAATTNALAERFRLTPTQIGRAVVVAERAHAIDRCDGAGDDLREALFAAAREQSGHRIADLAQRIVPRYRLDDIVLPVDAKAQLDEICGHVKARALVLERWGFDRRLSQGKGTSVLFSGPSGTGKTMAAEIIAHELGLDLYRIDLATVVSKYIGETEQNLERIFSAADDANGVLLFDEADALFGKRSEVRDSHDRYANLEISYLLQRIERYNGIAILASNLRQNLDDAFIRRLAFMVAFPFPDAADRRRIWQSIWPRETPLASDVDFGFLAERFKFSGGHIKNTALAAAFLAANDGGVVTMAHLIHATGREYQKSGKILSETELNGSSVIALEGRRA